MIRSSINLCLFAVISLLFGVIWQGPAYAAAPTMTNLGQLNDTFLSAAALDIDAAGNLYVADADLSVGNIYKYNQYGNLIATFPVPGLRGGGMAVGADGRIFASVSTPQSANNLADKVVVLDAAGTEIGALGAGADAFVSAGSIDLDVNGNIYVVDQSAHHVKVFNPDTTGGSVFGGLTFPESLSLAVDTYTNEIYVANYAVNPGASQYPTLYVYDAAGQLLRSILASSGFGNDELSRFGGITFDDSARFYIGDATFHSLRVMDKPATQVLKVDAGIDTAPSMVYDPLTKRLFVNHANATIDIFGIDGGTTPVKANDAPTIPVPVTAGEQATLTPALIFNNSVDTDGDTLTYNVEVLQGATPVTSFTVDADAGATTSALVNVTLTENGSYTWRVQADDGALTSAWSATLPITINATEELPTAPALQTPSNGADAGDSDLLSWTASTDADPNSSIEYRVEILGTSVTTTTTSLNVDLASVSATLTSGAPYSWQVVAIDNTGLTATSGQGSFVYKSSALDVVSNVPGATVTLTGHHGYAGRFVGTTPVGIRGLADGDYTVVVEAAGFEPVVTLATVVADTQTDVIATLKGARLATTFATHALNLANQPVLAVDATPIVADLDQDGILDLVLADNGFIDFYKGSKVADPLAADTIEDVSVAVAGTESVVFAAAPVRLAIPQTTGAAPCLVDWNNDDKLDLIIGGADGTVKIFMGQGGTIFSAVADATLINVSSQAVPAVADVDGDGNKDLVVATDTELLLIANVGSDSAPLLGSQTTMSALTSPAAPIFTDWDADGDRDLMLLSQGTLSLAEVVGGVVTNTPVAVMTVTGAERVFALNTAGSSYKDLVFATASGSLVVANGQLGEFSPAFQAALQSKLVAIETAVLNQAPELIGKVANINSRIARGRYDSAAKKAEQLAAILAADSAAELMVIELVGLLN